MKKLKENIVPIMTIINIGTAIILLLFDHGNGIFYVGISEFLLLLYILGYTKEGRKEVETFGSVYSILAADEEKFPEKGKN